MFAQQTRCRLGAGHKQLYPAFLPSYISTIPGLHHARGCLHVPSAPRSYCDRHNLGESRKHRVEDVEIPLYKEFLLSGKAKIMASPTSHGCPAPQGIPWTPRTQCPWLSHCRMSHPCPGCGSRSCRGMLLSPRAKANTDFSGHFLLSVVFTPL